MLTRLTSLLVVCMVVRGQVVQRSSDRLPISNDGVNLTIPNRNLKIGSPSPVSSPPGTPYLNVKGGIFVDGQSISASAPRGGTLPLTCSTGDLYFLTSGAIGLYQCISANTWAQLLAVVGGPFLMSGATGATLTTPSAGFVFCGFGSVADTFQCINETGKTYTLGAVDDAKVTFTDVTTGNASAAMHGFAPKGNGNTATFLNGNYAFSTPPSTTLTDDPSIFLLKDEFPETRFDVDPLSELSWFIGGGAGTPTRSNVNPGTGHPGVKAVGTGSVSGNNTEMHLSYSSFHNIANLNDFTSWQTTWIGQIDNAAGVAGIASVGWSYGLTSTPTSATNMAGAGWYVAMDTTAPQTCFTGVQNGVTSVTWNTANIMYVMRNASNYTCLDSGVAAQSGVWYHFQISSAGSGAATFTINGVNAATITSGGPGTTAVSPILYIITHTSAGKIAWHDFWSLSGKVAR